MSTKFWPFPGTVLEFFLDLQTKYSDTTEPAFSGWDWQRESSTKTIDGCHSLSEVTAHSVNLSFAILAIFFFFPFLHTLLSNKLLVCLTPLKRRLCVLVLAHLFWDYFWGLFIPSAKHRRAPFVSFNSEAVPSVALHVHAQRLKTFFKQWLMQTHGDYNYVATGSSHHLKPLLPVKNNVQRSYLYLFL